MAVSLTCTMTVSAQRPQTDDGREVKRISFDCEKVTIEYVDGTQDDNIDETKVSYPTSTTRINATTRNTTTTKRQYYTTDGRRLQSEPTKKGVYIERNGKRAVKKIKK